jgi:hypothetical protein
MNNWQPINTAPKNEFVLIYAKGWDHNTDGIDIARLYGNNWLTTEGLNPRPTHWMPLPKAPD